MARMLGETIADGRLFYGGIKPLIIYQENLVTSATKTQRH